MRICRRKKKWIPNHNTNLCSPVYTDLIRCVWPMAYFGYYYLLGRVIIYYFVGCFQTRWWKLRCWPISHTYNDQSLGLVFSKVVCSEIWQLLSSLSFRKGLGAPLQSKLTSASQTLRREMVSFVADRIYIHSSTFAATFDASGLSDVILWWCFIS